MHAVIGGLYGNGFWRMWLVMLSIVIPKYVQMQKGPTFELFTRSACTVDTVALTSNIFILICIGEVPATYIADNNRFFCLFSFPGGADETCL